MALSDDRQYAPATLRNRDFILDVLRDVLPMTDVIEIASSSASISAISRKVLRLSFSNLLILIPAERRRIGEGHRCHEWISCRVLRRMTFSSRAVFMRPLI
jgi:hypothetical protein